MFIQHFNDARTCVDDKALQFPQKIEKISTKETVRLMCQSVYIGGS